MFAIEKEVLVCVHCQAEVQATEEYCPHCGMLFEEERVCANHHAITAKGACVICGETFCRQCGGWRNDRFLCRAHASYEIYEGMARIYGTLDDSIAQYAHACLEQAGLHPFLFAPTQPWHGSRMLSNTILHAGGDAAGHAVYEVKVMVPCAEALAAEKLLRELQMHE